MENNTKVIALLIDAENVSPKYISSIVKEVAIYGTPAYKRIYGDWTSQEMSAWKKVLLEWNLTPIQQFSYTQGKNASDSAMIIDAMDILYAGHVDGFCIVSSDSDFTKLAARLRESRMLVIGMGETKTPMAFKAACDTFKYLEVLMNSKEPSELRKGEDGEGGALPQDKPDKPSKKAEKAARPSEKQEKSGKKAERAEKQEKAAGKQENEPFVAQIMSEEELAGAIVPLSDIVASIHNIIDYDSDEDGWMLLSQVGITLSRLYPEFDSRNYGYSRLHKLIEATGQFETKYEKLPGGRILMIRALS
ncbi:MAG: NYN domain-containing protein [Pygmaiobacter massiliensis]|nr:NYN domain-containing protein [Pygmaiobacter massiliensis]